jgi:hypothetical protein
MATKLITAADLRAKTSNDESRIRHKRLQQAHDMLCEEILENAFGPSKDRKNLTSGKIAEAIGKKFEYTEVWGYEANENRKVLGFPLAYLLKGPPNEGLTHFTSNGIIPVKYKLENSIHSSINVAVVYVGEGRNRVRFDWRADKSSPITRYVKSPSNIGNNRNTTMSNTTMSNTTMSNTTMSNTTMSNTKISRNLFTPETESESYSNKTYNNSRSNSKEWRASPNAYVPPAKRASQSTTYASPTYRMRTPIPDKHDRHISSQIRSPRAYTDGEYTPPMDNIMQLRNSTFKQPMSCANTIAYVLPDYIVK